jgi:predicted esterase
MTIFLHGLGDTSPNFSHFPRALNLPETLCLTLQAPFPLHLPMPAGHYHWGDDILIDSDSGDIEPDASFSKSATLLSEDVIKDVLIAKCGFQPREILILGYGQGGMAGLDTARSLGPEIELGGVISIGGPLPTSCMLVNGPKIGTPVLLLGGAKGLIVRSDGVKRMKGTFENVEYVQWKKGDDGMPASTEEALPMMQFLGRTLRSRKGVLEGSVEVG